MELVDGKPVPESMKEPVPPREKDQTKEMENGGKLFQMVGNPLALEHNGKTPSLFFWSPFFKGDWEIQ